MKIRKTYQLAFIKTLVCFFIFSFSIPAFSLTCSDYFSRKSWTPKQLLLEEILEKDTPITGSDWINYLRAFTENPDAFPGAENAPFRFMPGNGYYQKGDSRGNNWRQYLHMPQLKSWRITRNSHIQIPKGTPHNQAEAARFMIELAYSLQRYHQNLHADLLSNRIPIDRTLLQAKLDLLRQRKTDLHNSDLSILQKRLISIKIKFTEIFVRLGFEIKQRTPFAYSRSLHSIMNQYDKDILSLYEELQALLQSPLVVPVRSYKERSKWISYTNAVFVSLTKWIFPFSFYKPLDGRILDYNALKNNSSPQNTQAQALSKWLSDKITTFSLAIYLSASWHLGASLPHNIENVIKFTDYIASIDTPKIIETIKVTLSTQEKKNPLQIHEEFLERQNGLVLMLQEDLKSPGLTAEQIKNLSLRIQMHENLIAEETSTWSNYNEQ